MARRLTWRPPLGQRLTGIATALNAQFPTPRGHRHWYGVTGLAVTEAAPGLMPSSRKAAGHVCYRTKGPNEGCTLEGFLNDPYSIFAVGPNGHFVWAKDIMASNDAAARERDVSHSISWTWRFGAGGEKSRSCRPVGERLRF